MSDIIDTTMIYLKKDDSYLLLLRNKKKNDINEGKWIGIGGHVEENETIASFLEMGWTDLFDCRINKLSPEAHPERQIYVTIKINRHGK